MLLSVKVLVGLIFAIVGGWETIPLTDVEALSWTEKLLEEVLWTKVMGEALATTGRFSKTTCLSVAG